MVDKSNPDNILLPGQTIPSNITIGYYDFIVDISTLSVTGNYVLSPRTLAKVALQITRKSYD